MPSPCRDARLLLGLTAQPTRLAEILARRPNAEPLDNDYDALAAVLRSLPAP